ncbi:DUF2244 domain-containing protein [Thalassovita mangrovi]|uniref:DUF2244 domain-containing protein n=1 Tax=Thalassovita mangrovi TaxID=2692236 RepID=A0A6L8LF54_9RHOB|nr:DUF2244 domain-containing protein [Thalassovita mangrovi]MYM54707.1 DUF2244 domain-containing protein [Thalassovita mangrovi]
MPYRWTDTDDLILTLRPHRSLPRRGFAAMILMAFLLGTVPLYGLLGTVFLWGLLPFVLAMVGALWWGLERSYRDGDILEELRLRDHDLVLSHKPARGETKEWACNIYWVRAEMHVSGGPVPFYVTLSGNGRTVEIGAFLSEDERKALFGDLQDKLTELRAESAPDRG